MVIRNPLSFCLVLLLALLGSLTFAQKPTVHQALYSRPNTIVIATDRLVVLDTADQFLEIQFHGRCAKSSTTTPPKTTIDVFSRSLSPLYEKDDDHRLKMMFDGVAIDFGLLKYNAAQEIEAQTRDIYSLPGEYRLVERIPTPATAQVKTSHPGKFLVAEQMSTSKFLTVELLNRVAAARQISFTLGSTGLRLNEEQRALLVDFARAVNLPDQNAPEVDPKSATAAAVLPALDLDNASLEATLDWLKKRMAISGRIITPQGAFARYDLLASSGCEITVGLDTDQVVPPYEIPTYSASLIFAANLAMLDPERVRIDDSQNNSIIWLATANGKHGIEGYLKQGGTGKKYDSRMTGAACIYLRKDGSAPMVRDALVHAMKLCQAPR